MIEAPGFADAPALDTPPGWVWPWQVPAADALRVADVALLLALERSPPAHWQPWQQRRLGELLAHVQRASPGWRQRLPAGRIRFTDLPALARADFRALCEAEGPLPMPPAHGRAVPHSTSGSTGMPVKFWVSEHALRLVRNHFHADHVRHGRDTLAVRAALGSRTDPHPGQAHVFARGNPWLAESHLHTRRNVDFSFEDHARWLTRLAPAWLAVNPTVLSGILEVYEAGTVAPPAGLTQCVTFGSTVEPRLRERTRAALGASIRDRYSCEEVGPLAWQCPHDASDAPPYHVAISHAIVEVADDAGRPLPAGTVGRVLVTGLHHWASPAIRYDIGDLAAMHPGCPSCGAQVPTLTQLLGRKRALLRSPTGRSIFVRLTAGDWLDVAPVREFRLIQQDARRIRVELVLAGAMDDALAAAIRAMLARRIGAEFDWELAALDRIDWPPGTKRQDVVCLL